MFAKKEQSYRRRLPETEQKKRTNDFSYKGFKKRKANPPQQFDPVISSAEFKTQDRNSTQGVQRAGGPQQSLY